MPRRRLSRAGRQSAATGHTHTCSELIVAGLATCRRPRSSCPPVALKPARRRVARAPVPHGLRRRQRGPRRLAPCESRRSSSLATSSSRASGRGRRCRGRPAARASDTSTCACHGRPSGARSWSSPATAPSRRPPRSARGSTRRRPRSRVARRQPRDRRRGQERRLLGAERRPGLLHRARVPARQSRGRADPPLGHGVANALGAGLAPPPAGRRPRPGTAGRRKPA